MKLSIGRILFPLAAVVVLSASVHALLSGPAEKRDGVELSYGMFGTPEQLEEERKLLTVFEKEHPGIRVRLRAPSSGGYMEKLMTEFAGRVAPDVTFMGVEHFQSFAKRNAFMSLEKLLAADPEFDREAYFPEILKAFSRDGELMALPKNAASDVLFYNKEHFDAAGLSYPDSSWKWADLVEAARQLTKDTNGDGRPDQFGLSNISFLDLLRQHGVEIISEDGTRCTLNTPAALECCRFVRDLVFVHKVLPTQSQMAGFGFSGGGAGSMGMFDLFPSGYTSMMIFDVVLALKFQNAKFDWDTAVQPAGPTRDSYIHGAGYAINRRTEYPKESWELVKFLAGPYVQKVRSRGGESLPSLRALATSETWLKADRPPWNRQAVTDQMLTAEAPPPHAGWPRIMNEVWALYSDITSEENPTPPEKALEKAEKRINRILRGD